MIYALNLFNLIPGKENDYRDYSVRQNQHIHYWKRKHLTAKRLEGLAVLATKDLPYSKEYFIRKEME